ncbi:MAG TPA: proton-conducting transporter membrane subunit [Candidatus Limnocylindria bacterium]|nr:proton-conducting transporter membrane subunit [Candidatus Limnocylindria bacterium]
MTVASPAVFLALAACAAFGLRKRINDVAWLSLSAILITFTAVSVTPVDTAARLLDVDLRVTALGRLAGLIILATIAMLIVDVVLDEPAYNFFPTALVVGAVALAVLMVGSPIIIFALLVLGLLVPVGTFTFQVHRNRSVEAAVRHFSFVMLGGSLGLGALAVAASLPKDQPATTVVLLVVLLFVAFALMLAAIPFHTHAALLAGEAPASALALYFGVLVPVTFIAFAEILAGSGLLPAIVQVSKVQDLLLAIGLTSAFGGALLAAGANDLRRLVVYAVISNLGSALVGIATFSGPGIIGGIATALVTGACATQQLLAAGALERRAAGERPNVIHAPLAAGVFIAGGIAMIGAPPLVTFPGHFFVDLIAYAVSGVAGSALVASAILLLIAQLRAGVQLFAGSTEGWRIESRPVGGVLGGLIFLALLVGGITPDAFLRPIAEFADEFLKALRPL